MLISACGWIDLNVDLNRNDEKTNGKENNVEKFEVDDFPAVKPYYDRNGHAHQTVTGHTAPQNRILELLAGRIQTQDNPLPQQITRSQNLATHISLDNILLVVEQTPQGQKSDSDNSISRLA